MEHLRDAEPGMRFKTTAGAFTVIRYIPQINKVVIVWDSFPDQECYMEGGAILAFMALA